MQMIAEANKKVLGPRWKGEQKAVIAAIEGLEEDAVLVLKDELEKHGKAMVDKYEILSSEVSFSTQRKLVVEMKYTPSVIEPSFGVGRLLYAVLENAFSQRAGDAQRCVMAFKPIMAPIKVSCCVSAADWPTISDP